MQTCRTNAYLPESGLLGTCHQWNTCNYLTAQSSSEYCLANAALRAGDKMLITGQEDGEIQLLERGAIFNPAVLIGRHTFHFLFLLTDS